MKYIRVLALCSIFLASAAFAESIPVHIATAKGDLELSLEFATTPSTREHGLMDRKTLRPADGMLFVFPKLFRFSFWMKNTLVPLDMLFMDENGVIVNIGANTTPLSRAPVDSVKPALSVIEIDAGRAAGSGIAIGDKVIYTLPATAHVE